MFHSFYIILHHCFLNIRININIYSKPSSYVTNSTSQNISIFYSTNCVRYDFIRFYAALNIEKNILKMDNQITLNDAVTFSFPTSFWYKTHSEQYDKTFLSFLVVHFSFSHSCCNKVVKLQPILRQKCTKLLPRILPGYSFVHRLKHVGVFCRNF